MSSKIWTSTEIADYRQAAEAEIVSGVQSQLALPGGIALGEGASLSITGATPLDAGKTFETMLSNADSALGRVLGVTSQLAQGLFEQTPAGIAEAQQASILGGDGKLVLIGLGILLLFGVLGSRK